MARASLLVGLLYLATSIDAVRLVTNDATMIQEGIAGNAYLQKMHAEAVQAIAKELKRNAERARAGNMPTYNRTNPKDVPKILAQASNFLIEKRALVAAHKRDQALHATHANKTKQSEILSVIGSLVDGLLILAKMNDGRELCPLTVVIFWWVLGTVTLMVDQGLNFAQALYQLGLMVTTVGYGQADPVTNNGLKIFHSLHSVLAIIAVADPTNDMFDKVIGKMFERMFRDSEFNRDTRSKMKRFAPLAATVVASTLGFALDVHLANTTKYPYYANALLDTLYLTLITCTTIGYGDVYPQTNVGMVFAVPWMIWSSRIFAKSFMSKDEAVKGASKTLMFYECADPFFKKSEPASFGDPVVVHEAVPAPYEPPRL